ncbi:MAG: hypothetical protein K0M45_02640 [Candidatus Paracaedibacteraceae bacterium]|nr:hypothetical protein [Candidatus Paracaedibacteraceae bacterium]
MIAVPFLSACDEVTLYRGDTSTDLATCKYPENVCSNSEYTFDLNNVTLTKESGGRKEVSTFSNTDGDDYYETSRTIICPNGKTTTFYPAANTMPPATPSSPQDPAPVCTRM